MTTFAQPPIGSPFFSGSHISEPWVAWLRQVATTGTIVQTLQQQINVAEDNSTDGNSSSILSEVLDALSILIPPPRPAAPADLVPGPDADVVRLQSQIDELRMLVSLADGAYDSAGAAAVSAAAINASTNKNLVPDSDLKLGSAYWTAYGAMSQTAGAGADGGNAFTVLGTGAAVGTLIEVTQPIVLVPGATYTISGYIDASAVTSGFPAWYVLSVSLATTYAQIIQTAGAKGRLSVSFVAPAGATRCVVVADTNNCTVANAGVLVFSNAQLEAGAAATPYKPNLLADLAGTSGTITIPKLTTANGSITVVNGIITAFTNPT